MNITHPSWWEPLCVQLAELKSPQPGEAGLVRLRKAIVEVESLLSRHEAEMPADLVHFLQRRSYEKAAQYCQSSQGIPRGTCGGKS